MPAPGWSLGRRLAGRILVATGLAWVLVLAAGLAVMWHEMREVADKALTAEASHVAIWLAGDGEPPEAGGTATVRMRVGRPGAAPTEAPWPPLARDGAQEIDGWSVVRVTAPSGLWVEIGQEVALRRREFWEAARVWLIMTVPLLGLLLLVSVRTVRSALGPVATFAAAMDARRASDLSPLPDAGLPEELRPIPRALARYLSRIEALLGAERDFSANAAHELRTPLSVAAAQAQLLVEGRGGPKAAEAVRAAVGRLATTVDRLLELARAEAGTGRIGDRCDVLRVLRLLAAEAPPGRVRLDDADREALDVAADADAAELVFGNLLRNAVQHGTGPVRVTVGEGPSVEIANPVGPGAAFRPGRFARRPGSAGSGLGLAIAAATAERLGWELGFAIRDGVATARVSFPEAGLARGRAAAGPPRDA